MNARKRTVKSQLPMSARNAPRVLMAHGPGQAEVPAGSLALRQDRRASVRGRKRARPTRRGLKLKCAAELGHVGSDAEISGPVCAALATRPGAPTRAGRSCAYRWTGLPRGQHPRARRSRCQCCQSRDPQPAPPTSPVWTPSGLFS